MTATPTTGGFFQRPESKGDPRGSIETIGALAINFGKPTADR
jgi:hypothetical protein